MVRWQRLRIHYIEPGARELAASSARRRVGSHHTAAPRNIDEEGSGLQDREELRVIQAGGLVASAARR